MTEQFINITNLIISKLEGGYYHPDMKAREPNKFAAMGISGETMFGMDRKTGGDDVTNSIEGKEFWEIIDNANAKTTWKYNSKGGIYESKLRELATKMMYNRFERYSNKYLSEKAKKTVNNDPKLLFHFVYACWNGAWWFQYFATKINDAISKMPIVNYKKLWEIAIDSRINNIGKSGKRIELISKGGKTIEKILTGFNSKKNILKFSLIFVLIAGAGVGGYLYYKKRKRKQNERTAKIPMRRL